MALLQAMSPTHNGSALSSGSRYGAGHGPGLWFGWVVSRYGRIDGSGRGRRRNSYSTASVRCSVIMPDLNGPEGPRWYTFDARHNRSRIGRIVMARGRDATDCALSTSFGTALLGEFKVHTDEVLGDFANNQRAVAA